MERYTPLDVTIIAQAKEYLAGRLLLTHGTQASPKRFEVYVLVQLGQREVRRYYTNVWRAKAIFDKLVAGGGQLSEVDGENLITTKEECVELLDRMFA